jgi:hypothetical protein
MTERVQWRTLSKDERNAFTFIVGMIVNEGFDLVHCKLWERFAGAPLDALVNKGLLVELPMRRTGLSYALGAEGKRLAMLHKLAPQFPWETLHPRTDTT